MTKRISMDGVVEGEEDEEEASTTCCDEESVSTRDDSGNDGCDDDDEGRGGGDGDEMSSTFSRSCSMEDQTVSILCEVVGGYQLRYEDDDGSRRRNKQKYDDEEMYMHAFVQCRYGSQMHKTKSAEQPGHFPIWSIHTNSFFVLTTTASELSYTGLHLSAWFKRKDPLQLAAVTKKCFIGKATVEGASMLSHCDEKHFQVDLYAASAAAATGGGGASAARGRPNSSAAFAKPLLSGTKKQPASRGSLTLRMRLATPDDRKFVELCRCQPETYRQIVQQTQRPVAPLTTETDEAKVVSASIVQALTSAFTSKRYFDTQTGQHKMLVKPYPDPRRVSETTYLTKHEISAETMKPSHEWVEAGSGTLGNLYLEVLCCNDLPNVDVGEAVGNLSDCFVCGVFEDSLVQTPVIDDELNPHWLPWTQRAFIFKMMHPASILYLGVFDFDVGIGNHESIGRAAVNISNLQRNTDYTLRYNLYKSANVIDRTPSGSILIRLRIEYRDEKEALLAALKPRPKCHVNVRREKSLAVVRYTCFGEYGDDNEQAFDLTVTRSYINEILEYWSSLKYCVIDSFWSLIFWEGQVKVFNVSLPVHSFLVFCSGITLVERPYMAPAWILLSVAWIMLATQTLRRQHPSPWQRCPPFWQYLEILRNNESSLAVRRINPHEGAKEAEEYESNWKKRIENDQRVAATKAALQEEMDILGDESIHTKKAGGIQLAPDLVARLSRYQGILASICRFFRFIKLIVMWEESIVSFWITAGFLIGGLVSLLLPWSFILLWFGRIFVWFLLGPHMKIVGAILQSSSEAQDKDTVQRVIETFKKKSVTARLRHQEAVKLKDVKRLSFGEYSTLIPSFNLSRHYDHPLPDSSARLQYGGLSNEIKIAECHVPGQQCSGGIIPRSGAAEEQYKAELPRLQKLLEDVSDCVKSIQDTDRYGLIEPQESFAAQEELPESAGYEIISFGDPMHSSVSSMVANPDLPISELLDKLSSSERQSARRRSSCAGPEASNTSANLSGYNSDVHKFYEVSPSNSLIILDTDLRNHLRRRRSSKALLMNLVHNLDSMSCNADGGEEEQEGIEVILAEDEKAMASHGTGAGESDDDQLLCGSGYVRNNLSTAGCCFVLVHRKQ